MFEGGLMKLRAAACAVRSQQNVKRTLSFALMLVFAGPALAQSVSHEPYAADLKARAASIFPAFSPVASKSNGEAVSWDSIVCRGANCEALKAKGWLFAQPGQTSVVIVSHGSVGVDHRVFDRVDQLQEAGFAALVVDHWGTRGIGEVFTDLKGAASKGATELNMVFDIYTAASFLRRQRDFDKVGAIGASFGGGAQIMAQQKWAMATVERAYQYHYKKPFVSRKLDAQVSLYGFCGLRNKVRDQFNGAPLLFINGEKDEMVQAAPCDDFVPWMNERGGNAKSVTLKGHYHTFDARTAAVYDSRIAHMGNCNVCVRRTHLDGAGLEIGASCPSTFRWTRAYQRRSSGRRQASAPPQ